VTDLNALLKSVNYDNQPNTATVVREHTVETLYSALGSYHARIHIRVPHTETVSQSVAVSSCKLSEVIHDGLTSAFSLPPVPLVPAYGTATPTQVVEVADSDMRLLTELCDRNALDYQHLILVEHVKQSVCVTATDGKTILSLASPGDREFKTWAVYYEAVCALDHVTSHLKTKKNPPYVLTLYADDSWSVSRFGVSVLSKGCVLPVPDMQRWRDRVDSRAKTSGLDLCAVGAQKASVRHAHIIYPRGERAIIRDMADDNKVQSVYTPGPHVWAQDIPCSVSHRYAAFARKVYPKKPQYYCTNIGATRTGQPEVLAFRCDGYTRSGKAAILYVMSITVPVGEGGRK
jgi:hypothetical protein